MATGVSAFSSSRKGKSALSSSSRGKSALSGTSSSSGALDEQALLALASQAGFDTPEPTGPSKLNRLLGLLTSAETGNTAYAALTGQNALKTYGTDMLKGVTLQGMPAEKKTYADVLKLLGVPDYKLGPISSRSIAGLGLDILLDPTTYFGGALVKKLGIPAAKKLGKAATKIPKVGPVLQKATEGLQDLMVPGAKVSRIGKVGEKGLTGADYYDEWLKMTKGMSAEERTLAETLAEASTFVGEKKATIPKIITTLEKSGKLGKQVTYDTPEAISETFMKLMKNWGIEEKELGILKGTIENYIPHVITPEAKALAATGKLDLKYLAKPLNYKLKAGKTRGIIGTIEGINAKSMEEYGVKLFEDDIFRITASRGIDHIRAKTVLNFNKEVGEKFGVSDLVEGGATKGVGKKATVKMIDGMPYVSTTLPGLEGRLVPKVIAEDLNKTYLSLTSDEAINKFLKVYDQVLATFKGSVTGWFPSFHGRNTIGGMFNNWIKGLWNPARYAQADAIARAGSESTEVIKLAGKEYTYGQIHRLMRETGVYGQPGMFDVMKTMDEMINPAKGLAKVATAPRKTMEFVENRLRGALFIDRMAKGDEPWKAAKEVFATHFDYAPEGITAFEKNVLRRIIPFYVWCVPEDTEILTKDGWKKYNELSIGEIALTYKKGQLEWQGVKDIAVFDYNGEMMRISNTYVDFLATPNHRWVVQDQEGNEKILRGYELRSNHRIPLTGNYQQEKSILSEREAAILGWLIIDGYTRWKGNHLEAMIYQSPQKYANEIRELLGEDCSSESNHPDSGVICFRVKASSLKNIKKYFKTKNSLMSIVTRLGIKEMKAMRDAMFKAEGNINLKSKCCFFSQDNNNLGVRDAFQFLSQMLGEPVNLNKRGGYIKKHKFLKLSDTISYSWYSGKVWCPVTENGTWFARRNGKIIPTGNTRNNIPFQLEQMAKQPGKYAAVGKTIRSLQGGTTEERKESELLPTYMKEGIPIRLGKTGQNKANYLYSLGLPIEDINNISGRKLLGMTAPPAKFLLEKLTGQNFYLNKPIKEVNSAPQILRKAPKPIKDWLEYREEKNKNGDTIRKLNPYKWHFVSSLFGPGPISSRSLYLANKLSDPKVLGLVKVLYGSVGISGKEVDFTQEEYWRNQERVNQLIEYLEGKGVLKNFQKAYIPKK